ncbi:MAG: hypothetical protein IBX62_09755 [Coriobacteriia bacterium]|nr:hypothetical protein [Coriobacteriia bacterium]
MADTRQRAELFAVLRRMEAATVAMYEAALLHGHEGSQGRLREEHERHVDTLDDLLGACTPQDVEAPRDVRESLETHVTAVLDAGDEDEALERLLEAERTNAAEYAVAEGSRLSEAERGAVRRLHEEQRALVRALEEQLPADVVARRGVARSGHAGGDS